MNTFQPRALGRVPGRFWAYLGAVLGGVVSIAANVAHSYIPPKGAPITWAPEPGAVIGSVFWPVALFVAVEILTRIPWPDGHIWRLLRFGGLVPVALVAAVVSYRHLSGLLAHYQEDTLTVHIGPLAVDGLMVMATGALLATGTHTLIKHIPVKPVTVETVADGIAGEPAPDSVPVEAPVFAPWATPTPAQPARVNGRQAAEVVNR